LRSVRLKTRNRGPWAGLPHVLSEKGNKGTRHGRGQTWSASTEKPLKVVKRVEGKGLRGKKKKKKPGRTSRGYLSQGKKGDKFRREEKPWGKGWKKKVASCCAQKVKPTGRKKK